MKIFINDANESWIVDRLKSEFIKENSNIIVNNPKNADIIWLIAPWLWRYQNNYNLTNKKIITTVHHVDPIKFDKSDFMTRDNYTNAYHVPCLRTKVFIQQFTKKPVYQLPYWFNDKLWKPIDRLDARKKLGFNKNDFIIGSFQRDTEGNDLKSPKLCKGADLLGNYFDYNKTDNLIVLLGGWRRQYIINRLERVGIRYKYIEMGDITTLRAMYSALDLYIVSSREEGGPQALLEAGGMKIPIISNDVGMARAVLHKNCVFNINNKNYIPTKNDIDYTYNNIMNNFTLGKLSQNYKDMFTSVLNR